MPELTHLNAKGEAAMVDISEKDVTSRIARASAVIVMAAETMDQILDGQLHKGDVLAVARIAGIQAAKKCADLIPLCHSLALNKVRVDFEKIAPNRLKVIVEARVSGKTGVEMEALTGASIASLTVYDMCKAIDKNMSVTELKLLSKTGGKSGDWQRACATGKDQE